MSLKAIHALLEKHMISRRLLDRVVFARHSVRLASGLSVADEKRDDTQAICGNKKQIPGSSFSPPTLHDRVLEWDRDLPVTPPPSMSSLVHFLTRRRCSSRQGSLTTSINTWMTRAAMHMLGLQKAQKRLETQHEEDPDHNCWYCPGDHGDTFGIRHDEIYFHEGIIPTQPVTSYAVLIRGSPLYPGTAVKDGIGEGSHPENGETRNFQAGTENVMAHRGASLVLSLLEARKFYESREFKQERFREKALSMQWYKHIFSTSMQFYPGCIERYTSPPGLSRHIVVMVAGNMYKVDVVVEDEHGNEAHVTHDHIVKQFQAIIESEQNQVNLSTITTLPPVDRCREEQRLKARSGRNLSNLSIIRDSLFIVCLDPDDSPCTANEAMYALHSKNFTNRWYDKSVQLVVFGNGVAGFVNNYLAAMTGTVATNFVGHVVRNEVNFSSVSREAMACDEPNHAPSLLRWDDTPDGYFAKKTAAILQSGRTTGPFKPPSRDVHNISLGYNFEGFCKKTGMSPGGLFQAALQLALARMAGRDVRVTEVVSLRHLRFGGMTFMDSSMANMREFVQQSIKFSNSAKPRHTEIQRNNSASPKTENYQQLRELLRRACEEYKDTVIRYKKGEIHLWHLDSLYRILGLPNRLPYRDTPASGFKHKCRIITLNLLSKPLINVLPAQVPENVTSNPLWVPEIEAIGRPGVKCILPRKCMALHYMFGRKGVSVTVNANEGHPCHDREEMFIEYLKESLIFVKQLTESPKDC